MTTTPAPEFPDEYQRIDDITKYHQPKDDTIKNKHEQIRNLTNRTMKQFVDVLGPDATAEKAKAIRALEDAMMYANSHIARYLNYK